MGRGLWRRAGQAAEPTHRHPWWRDSHRPVRFRVPMLMELAGTSLVSDPGGPVDLRFVHEEFVALDTVAVAHHPRPQDVGVLGAAGVVRLEAQRGGPEQAQRDQSASLDPPPAVEVAEELLNLRRAPLGGRRRSPTVEAR